MILLKLELTLQSNQPKSAVSASKFLGGVLHGIFERMARIHAPIILNELGITLGSQLKHYAILPPPYEEPISNRMQCGVILYGQAKQYTQVVIATLKKWDELRLEGRTDKIILNKISYHSPGMTTFSCYESTQYSFIDVQPNFTLLHPACDNLTIHFFTPFTLRNTQKISAVKGISPPNLLRLIRSISDRIKLLEPDLATSLGVGSSAWIEAEEQIRRITADWHQLKQVRWMYGSCTKQRPFSCNGLLGKIHYTGHIPALLTTLLHWGRWFGIGESPTLGQGMYFIQEPLIRFERDKL